MHRRHLATAISMVQLGSCVAWAVQQKTDSETEPGSLWLTPLMVERVIDHITLDLAERYDLDEDQLYHTRRLFKERVPRWLSENRAALQPLVNELVETHLGLEPPTKEFVADWSRRARPLLQEWQEVVLGMATEMRGFMRDEQILSLEGDEAALRAGVTFLDKRLLSWEQGGFDRGPWPPDQRRRVDRQQAEELARRMEEARRKALEAGAVRRGVAISKDYAAAAGKPTEPNDEWEAYVQAFVKKYQLDADQSAAAYRFLRQQQERRDGYVQRNAEQMRQITSLLDDPDTRERGLAQYAQFIEPVEGMFTVLKDKLAKLPTRKQRQLAGDGKSKPGVGPREDRE